MIFFMLVVLSNDFESRISPTNRNKLASRQSATTRFISSESKTYSSHLKISKVSQGVQPGTTHNTNHPRSLGRWGGGGRGEESKRKMYHSW